MPKILIFEDDGFLRGMYVNVFKRDGFTVAAYEHPTYDPVGIVVKEKPDIISMDVIMPVMNGFDAAAKIKTDPRTKDIPLIFLVNLGQPEDIKRGLALGAVKYLIKADHQPHEVVAMVKEMLAGH